jgi:hypothetical protein
LEGQLLGMNRLDEENCRVLTTMLRGSYLPPFKNFPRNNRQMLTLDPISVNYLFVTYSDTKPIAAPKCKIANFRSGPWLFRITCQIPRRPVRRRSPATIDYHFSNRG